MLPSSRLQDIETIHEVDARSVNSTASSAVRGPDPPARPPLPRTLTHPARPKIPKATISPSNSIGER